MSTPHQTRSRRLSRWQDRMDVPMLLAAGVFLVVYAVPIVRPGLPGTVLQILQTVQVAVWVLFAVDLAVRLALAPSRRRYLLRNWLDALAVALPVLRPVAALRAVFARSLLGGRGAALFGGQVAVLVAVAASLVGTVAALAVLDAERGHPDANIVTVQDALWWAMTTVTTVGYGDRYPVTGTGRLVASGLMITGIALLGVVTATLASWFVDRVGAEDDARDERTGAGVEALLAEVRALRAEVARLGGSGGPDGPGGPGGERGAG